MILSSIGVGKNQSFRFGSWVTFQFWTPFEQPFIRVVSCYLCHSKSPAFEFRPCHSTFIFNLQKEINFSNKNLGRLFFYWNLIIMYNMQSIMKSKIPEKIWEYEHYIIIGYKQYGWMYVTTKHIVLHWIDNGPVKMIWSIHNGWSG